MCIYIYISMYALVYDRGVKRMCYKTYNADATTYVLSMCAILCDRFRFLPIRINARGANAFLPRPRQVTATAENIEAETRDTNDTKE